MLTILAPEDRTPLRTKTKKDIYAGLLAVAVMAGAAFLISPDRATGSSGNVTLDQAQQVGRTTSFALMVDETAFEHAAAALTAQIASGASVAVR